MKIEEKINISTVLDIINNYCTDEEKQKISKKFMAYLVKNSSDNYISTIDYTKSIKDLNINNEVKAYLMLIYRDYIANDNEKEEFVKLIEKNDIENIKNIENLNKFDENKYTSSALINVEKEKWYNRILNKIKNYILFKMKK